jgi:hypothetical protein
MKFYGTYLIDEFVEGPSHREPTQGVTNSTRARRSSAILKLTGILADGERAFGALLYVK